MNKELEAIKKTINEAIEKARVASTRLEIAGQGDFPKEEGMIDDAIDLLENALFEIDS